MPKGTFFNLPEEKRDMICEVAVAEFAEYPFEQASINRIVANSGIAKGSFYQYFEDKRDLFLHLMDMAAEEKLKYVSPVMSNPDQHDFFSLIREMYLSGIKFANEHPGYAEISRRLLETKDAPIYKEVMRDNVSTANEFFEGLLETSVAKGEVRAEIDIKLVAHMIVSLTWWVVEYYLRQGADNYDSDMICMVDEVLSLVKNGIGERGV